MYVSLVTAFVLFFYRAFDWALNVKGDSTNESDEIPGKVEGFLLLAPHVFREYPA